MIPPWISHSSINNHDLWDLNKHNKITFKHYKYNISNLYLLHSSQISNLYWPMIFYTAVKFQISIDLWFFYTAVKFQISIYITLWFLHRSQISNLYIYQPMIFYGAVKFPISIDLWFFTPQSNFKPKSVVLCDSMYNSHFTSLNNNTGIQHTGYLSGNRYTMLHSYSTLYFLFINIYNSYIQVYTGLMHMQQKYLFHQIIKFQKQNPCKSINEH